MRRFLGLLLLLGIAEVVTIVVVASRFGAVPTFLLMIVTSASGAWLAKREGAGAWRRVRAAANQGRVPAVELIDATLVFLAGLFLFLPGFVSDLIGIALAIRPVRRIVGTWGLKLLERRVPIQRAPGAPPGFGFGFGAPGAPFGRPSNRTSPPGWVRADEVIDLDAEEYYVDEAQGEIDRR